MVDLDAALKLCVDANLILDDWQEDLLRESLEYEGEKWKHSEVCAIVPRQNGKGAVLEARELVGLFLDDQCELIIHSAHEFSTSLEHFRRLLHLVDSTPALKRRVKTVSQSHGKEGIELDDGSRIRFRTRTAGGGRGLSADLLVLDEAMILPEHAYNALLPTLSARPNPQTWLTGSAVDHHVHEHGLVLARARERGQAGKIAYREFSCGHDLAELLESPALMDDRSLWARANPALGGRIDPSHVAKERETMDFRGFACEVLGAGDWPVTDPTVKSLIPPALWRSLADEDSKPQDPIVLSFDVKPDRSKTAIAISGRREDDLIHIEIVDHREGTGWVAGRIAELVEKHSIEKVRCDAIGPAASLISDLASKGVMVETLSTSEVVQACSEFFDAAHNDKLRHLGTPELAAAVNGATTRNVGEAWAWARKKSTVDISPLVACTLAAWASAPVAVVEPMIGWLTY